MDENRNFASKVTDYVLTRARTTRTTGQTTIPRPVDGLGRVCLPKDFRRLLSIEVHEMVDISVEGNRIWLQKGVSSCLICNTTDNILEHKGKPLCCACLLKLTEK